MTTPTYSEPEDYVVAIGGVQGIAGPAGNAIPIADGTVLANKSGVLANPVGVSFSELRESLSINNVDNTSDSNKPISTATQTALDAKDVKFQPANVAALSSLTGLITGQVINLRGYYSAGDGGGQTLYYDAASEATVNGGTVFNGPGGTGRFLSLSPYETDTRQWGCIGNGVANDSVRLQAACNFYRGTSSTLVVTPGKYIVENIVVEAMHLRGLGGSSELKAVGSNPVIKLGRSYFQGPDWFVTNKIENLQIDGNNRNADGITFDGNATTPEFNNTARIEGVSFISCNRAIWKEFGNIGNSIKDCQFRSCNFGYKAQNAAHPAFMHAGFDKLNNCIFFGCSLAGVYINDTQEGGGGTSFRDCWFEGNPGFGVFIRYAFPSQVGGLVFDNCWMEANHTSPAVTIDSVTYTPRDYRFDGVWLASLNHCAIGEVELQKVGPNPSKAVARNCTTYGSLTKHPDCTMIMEDDFSSTTVLAGALYRNVGRVGANVPKETMFKTKQARGFEGSVFLFSGSTGFTQGSGEVQSQVNDGVFNSTCLQIVVPPATSIWSFGGFSMNATSGKWHYWSGHVKRVSGDGTFQVNYDFGFLNPPTITVDNVWRAYEFTRYYDTAPAGTSLMQITGGTTGTTWRVEACQLVKFDTYDELQRFADSHLLAHPGT